MTDMADRTNACKAEFKVGEFVCGQRIHRLLSGLLPHESRC